MKVIQSFFHDILREEVNGKFSSKKAWGHVFMILVGGTYVLDGLHWYTMNIHAFNSMLVASCTLIGLKTIKEIFKKSDNAPK